MKKNDLISVIVPVYNVERYLNRCIDSIINQTYKKLEIILIDDGSTDNSKKICNEYANENKKIKAIFKKNGGLSDARNKGIESATGKYITFVDPDDYVEKNFIETMYNNIIKYNADISIVGFKNVYEKKNNNEENKVDDRGIKFYNSKEAIEKLFDKNSFNNYAWNKLYKKSLFDSIKFPVNKKMEDLGTMYKLFSLAKKIIYQNIELYNYVIRDGSITNNKNIKFYQDMYELARERYFFIKECYPDMTVNKTKFYEICLYVYPFLEKKVEVKKQILKFIGRFNLNVINNISSKMKYEYIFFSISPYIYSKIMIFLKKRK